MGIKMKNDSFKEGMKHVFDQFPRYNMKIFLRDFKANAEMEDILKPIIGNVCLHEASNDNGVRVVNFSTLKNVIVNSTISPNRDIHKHTWTSPDGVTHNQIHHVLLDKRRNSKI
jgi:hypothetical protein